MLLLAAISSSLITAVCLFVDNSCLSVAVGVAFAVAVAAVVAPAVITAAVVAVVAVAVVVSETIEAEQKQQQSIAIAKVNRKHKQQLPTAIANSMYQPTAINN